MSDDATNSGPDLLRKRCVTCEGGATPLSPEEVRALLPKVPGWNLADDGLRIRREWVVKSFAAGIEFLDKVAELAEIEGHHPDVHLEAYRDLRIEIWTHSVKGLTENDFILAAKINEIPIKLRSRPAVS